MKRLSISVDDATHRTLKIFAVENDCSMNDIVVIAIEEYLHQSEKVDPDSATDETW